jgi:hypothetical protein
MDEVGLFSAPEPLSGVLGEVGLGRRAQGVGYRLRGGLLVEVVFWLMVRATATAWC